LGFRQFFERWLHNSASPGPAATAQPSVAPTSPPAVVAAAQQPVADTYRFASALDAVPAAPTVVSQHKTAVAGLRTSDRFNVSTTARDPRTGRVTAKTLRYYADRNAWIRIALNRRKSQIAQANWYIARRDRPTEKADPRVVKAVGDLFRFVNPKMESFRSLMDQVVEDLLVLDAGTIEIEKNLAGSIVALYAVDGATIAPDPDWDGSDPRAIRYRQFVNGQAGASWANDDMVYMMHNPSTTSVIGQSPVETLVRVIEAELYGESYDFKMLKQTSPAGVLELGPSVPPEDVDAFRVYYEDEMAGKRDVAIFGGGDPNAKHGGIAWHPMQRTAAEMQRREYMKWLATKIAAVFEMDMGVFNLTDTLHRTTAQRAQSLTDEGHKSLALLVQEYITREIVSQFDDEHCFMFADLNSRDEEAQGILDERALRMGVRLPNEIRARDGRGPLAYGSTYFIAGKGPWTGVSSQGQRPTDEGARNPLQEPAASAEPVNIDDEPNA
jgi:phage portal protein BeeE